MITRPFSPFVALALFVFSPSARAAGDFSASLNTGFAYNDFVGGGGGHADQYSVRGATLFTLDNPGISVQLEGGNDWIADADKMRHEWTAGADAFWRDNKGTIGLSAGYSAFDGGAQPFFRTRTAVESYGAFGEYYVSNNLTLQIKGGGTTGNAGAASEYGGGGLTFYDSPDVALHSEINFTAFTAGRDVTDVDTNLEYLPFGIVPVSPYAGYDWANVSRAGYVSTFFAGLKYRFGPGRELADEQRSGPIEWTGRAAPGAGLKF